MATVMDTYEKWKEFLGERVDQAKSAGMSEETISKLAFEIGQFLDEKVDPKNDQQRVLKELWDAGDDGDRQMLARLMVKLVD